VLLLVVLFCVCIPCLDSFFLNFYFFIFGGFEVCFVVVFGFVSRIFLFFVRVLSVFSNERNKMGNRLFFSNVFLLEAAFMRTFIDSTKPIEMKLFLFYLILLLPNFGWGQVMSTDYGNFTPCSGAIALYEFDFTATGSNQITQAGINSANSDNQCCGLPNNNGCLFFNVYIDSGAIGVSFSQIGAGGSVDIYYENCGSVSGANEDICLDLPKA
jgi:hypothetical protein